MKKDFYDFNHNQDMLDLTEELNVKVKALNPNIEIQLLDNDSSLIEGDSRLDGCGPKTEFTATIGLSIEYKLPSNSALLLLASNIPKEWPQKEKWPCLGKKVAPWNLKSSKTRLDDQNIAFWAPDKYHYLISEYVSHPSITTHYKTNGLNSFRVVASIKTPDKTTEKGRRFPEKRHEAFIDIVLQAESTTKYGLKIALQKEIKNIIEEMNQLDKRLRSKKNFWNTLKARFL